MSYRSTIFLADLPDGGEVHLYDTVDPAVIQEGQESQRRINIRPSAFDFDEEIPASVGGPRRYGR